MLYALLALVALAFASPASAQVHVASASTCPFRPRS